jgi:hypothetical protein
MTTFSLSPAQRWNLLLLSHHTDVMLANGDEGKRYRRFAKALGLDIIGFHARAQNGSVPDEAAKDERSYELFELEADALDFLVSLSKRPRSPVVEDLLGDVFDRAENAKLGLPVPEIVGDKFQRMADHGRWVKTKTPAAGLVELVYGSMMEPEPEPHPEEPTREFRPDPALSR